MHNWARTESMWEVCNYADQSISGYQWMQYNRPLFYFIIIKIIIIIVLL